MSISQIEVNDKTYNIEHASAVKQKELITLVGGTIIAATAQTGAEINTDLLTGMLIVLPADKLSKVEGLLLSKVILNNTSDKITIDDFADDTFNYFKLIAEALKANLQSFFTSLDESNAPRRRQLKTIREQQDLNKVS